MDILEIDPSIEKLDATLAQRKQLSNPSVREDRETYNR